MPFGVPLAARGAEIIPVTMKYCVVKLDEKKAKKKQERWQAIAESAAKQAKRSRIPEIKPVMSYKEAVAYAKQCKIQFVPYENERGMRGTKEAKCTVKALFIKGIAFTTDIINTFLL